MLPVAQPILKPPFEESLNENLVSLQFSPSEMANKFDVDLEMESVRIFHSLATLLQEETTLLAVSC